MQVLPCSSSELNVEVCLLNGQTFRFAKVGPDDEHPIIRGVALDRVWEFKRIDEESVSYKVLARFASAVEADDETVLRGFFQMDVDLLGLYEQWSNDDKNFRSQLENNFKHLTGIRIVRQDVLECFFAFICSSNNNVNRISSMVNSLCELYGDQIDVEQDGEAQTFYNFPTLDQLYQNRKGMEDQLKVRKFGYRAGWIVKAVKKLNELGGRQWLEELKARPYKEASETLISNFTGIGKKVSDCICLMSLEMNEVVPIDIHVFNITSNNYLTTLPKKYGECTPAHFKNIQEAWFKKFGQYAGWAQSMLFTNELRGFQQKKPVKRKLK